MYNNYMKEKRQLERQEEEHCRRKAQNITCIIYIYYLMIRERRREEKEEREEWMRSESDEGIFAFLEMAHFKAGGSRRPVIAVKRGTAGKRLGTQARTLSHLYLLYKNNEKQ